jgi:predicted phage-related endonuclease
VKIKKLQAELSPIVAAVKKTMGEATFGTVGGKAVVEWSTSTRETIDTRTLREEQPAIAAKYTRTTPVRTFRWVDPQ